MNKFLGRLFNAKPKEAAPAPIPATAGDAGWAETQSRLAQKLEQHAADEAKSLNRTAETLSELYPAGDPPAAPSKVEPDQWLQRFPPGIYSPGDASIYALNLRLVERVCEFYTPAEQAQLAEGDKIFLTWEKSKLAELGKRWDSYWKALEGATLTSVRQRLHAIVHDNVGRMAAGEETEIVPHHDDLLKVAKQVQRQAREGLASTSHQCMPVYQSVCERFRDAARRCADELDAEEKAQASEFGIPFSPSRLLQMVVWIGATGAMIPTLKKHHGASSGNPFERLWGVFHPRSTSSK